MQANPVAFPAYFPSEDGDEHIRFGNAEIKSWCLRTEPVRIYDEFFLKKATIIR